MRVNLLGQSGFWPSVLGLAATAVLGGCGMAKDMAFGPEVQRIKIGSSSSGTLERHEDRHLHVDSTYKLKKITTYVSARTREVVRRDEQWDFQNTYSWRDTASGTTDVWELVTTDLPGPTEAIVRVRGRGFTPIVTIFQDVSPRLLTFKDGFRVDLIDGSEREAAGAIILDPKHTYLVTVQAADDPVHADYGVALVPYSASTR
jgi:hypothetical protein